MNWVDLTDMLFCRAYGHLFTIKKPKYRNDIVEWRCIDSDDNVIAEGKTVLVSTAKNLCKDVYKQVKSADQSIYVKSNGKLTKSRYAKQVG
jgi:pantothenate kinase